MVEEGNEERSIFLTLPLRRTGRRKRGEGLNPLLLLQHRKVVTGEKGLWPPPRPRPNPRCPRGKGGKRGLPPARRLPISLPRPPGPPLGRHGTGSWGRRKRRRRGERLLSLNSLLGRLARGPRVPLAGGGSSKKKRQPTTAAITFTCPPGKYGEVMAALKAKIDLASLEIPDIWPRRALTGERENERADALAERIREELPSPVAVQVARRQKLPRQWPGLSHADPQT